MKLFNFIQKADVAREELSKDFNQRIERHFHEKL